jgi:hypothetical protein
VTGESDVKMFLPAIAIIPLVASSAELTSKWSGDDAIRRVENCVCYASVEGQNLKPWQIAWDDPEKLRKQISHYVCQAYIDVSRVENPRRYLVPGTTVK